MKRLRILLGDDHSIILKGIAGLLQDHYEVAGTAENGKAVVEAALRLKPDLVVLDVSMPILNGIDAAREIRKALPSVRVVFLSMHSSAIYLRKALEAGASAYVLKSGAAEELLHGIEEVCKGNLYISPSFGWDVRENLQDWRQKGARSSTELTDRQKQILQMLAEGKQNKEIAALVNISVRTVEFHRRRLMEQLGAHGVADLTRFAIQEGLIPGAGNH